MDRERRAALLQGKLRALVAEQLGSSAVGELTPLPYFGGTALHDAATSMVFVLVEAAEEDRDPMDVDPLGPRPPRGWLGGAIIAAARANATGLRLYADGHLINEDDARRASRCAIQTTCYSLIGRVASLVVPIDVSPPTTLADLPADEQTFLDVIVGSGAVAVVENGVLRAEVRGLEVGRVIREAETDRPMLQVGVGKHDRLAQSMMNSSTDLAVTLRNAVETVEKLRVPGAPSHPANTASRSRWLREMVITDPVRFGFEAPMVRLASTVPVDLKQSTVAALLANHQSHSVVVGCVATVDLDAPTDLLDVAHLAGCDRVMLVIPNDHDVPALRTLCATLTPTLTLVTTIEPFTRAE